VPENARLAKLRGGLLDAFGVDVLQRLPKPLPNARGQLVVVAGAGFAGLATAHFLVRLGFKVRVCEPRPLVGGRVHTNPLFVPEAKIEFGAELVGENHSVWLGLADAFGLSFRAVSEGSLAERPLLLDGKRYVGEAGAQIWQEVEKACRRLDPEARGVKYPYRPWLDRDLKGLDDVSLGDRLDSFGLSEPVRTAMEGLFSNDNVTPTAEQSLLGTLAQVSGGGFDDFWDKSETLRCAQGNDALAKALAKGLVQSRRASVELNAPLLAVSTRPDGATATVAEENIECAYVVLAMPPSVWDPDPKLKTPGITVNGKPIPDAYHVQLGPALKFFARVKGRYWRGEGLDPAGMATLRSLPANTSAQGETWEGTDNQALPPGGDADLSVFAGGPAAANALKRLRTLPSWYAAMLEGLLPGYGKHVAATEHMAWPREPWIATGYSCPAPGQVTTTARLLSEPYEDRALFAGEHACPAFFGYMEGALESALLAAGRVVGKYDEVAQALEHASRVPVGKSSGPAAPREPKAKAPERPAGADAATAEKPCEVSPRSSWRAVATAELERLEDELTRVGPDERSEYQVARKALDCAREAIHAGYGKDFGWLNLTWLKLFYSGAYIEETWTRLHEAGRAVLMVVDDAGARARVPFIRTAVREHVAESDPERKAMIDFLDGLEKSGDMSSADRERLRQIRAYADERSDLFQREVRAFRNYLLIFALGLGLLLLVLAVVGIASPRLISLCAAHDASLHGDYCPGGHAVARGFDIAAVELVGGIGGLVGALVRIRRARRLQSPYGIAVGQTLLKVITGAALAFIGVLLLQSNVLGGLSRQPGSHVIAYAALFGLAQQALTRLVDDRVGELAGGGGDAAKK
jgi:monoamine oxidase